MTILFKNCQSYMINKYLKYYLFLAIAFLANVSQVEAQSESGNSSKDFGMDLSIDGEKKLAKGLKLGFDAMLRTSSHNEQISRYGLGLNLSYKFFSTKDKKFSMKSELGIEAILKPVPKESEVEVEDHIDTESGLVDGFNEKYKITDSYWKNRQRYSAALAFAFEPSSRWSFSLKETFQYNHYNAKNVNRNEYKYKFRYVDEADPSEGFYLKDPDQTEVARHQVTEKLVESKNKTILRSKFTATYDIKKLKFDPFVSVDFGCGLNYNTTKWKYTAGVDYKLSKKAKLQIFYRYTDDSEGDDEDGHLVGAGCSFEF